MSGMPCLMASLYCSQNSPCSGTASCAYMNRLTHPTHTMQNYSALFSITEASIHTPRQ